MQSVFIRWNVICVVSMMVVCLLSGPCFLSLQTYSLTFKPPEALELYLQVVAEFTKHDSQVASAVIVHVALYIYA